jgi:cytochrome c oxidase subunit III
MQTAEATAHAHRDDTGARMGMWLFLFTELILFGGLFLIFAVYRFGHEQDFHFASRELNVLIGTINTLILLSSSLTMAMSITAIQQGRKQLSMVLIVLTILSAFGFMVNKYFEWAAKFHHGIYPGSHELLKQSNGVILYFGLYFVMTGLHALHIVIGVVILTFMLVFIARDKITPDSFVKLENAGLYWHLVDIIWIFLFPLFYLLH